MQLRKRQVRLVASTAGRGWWGGRAGGGSWQARRQRTLAFDGAEYACAHQVPELLRLQGVTVANCHRFRSIRSCAAIPDPDRRTTPASSTARGVPVMVRMAPGTQEQVRAPRARGSSEASWAGRSEPRGDGAVKRRRRVSDAPCPRRPYLAQMPHCAAVVARGLVVARVECWLTVNTPRRRSRAPALSAVRCGTADGAGRDE